MKIVAEGGDLLLENAAVVHGLHVNGSLAFFALEAADQLLVSSVLQREERRQRPPPLEEQSGAAESLRYFDAASEVFVAVWQP